MSHGNEAFKHLYLYQYGMSWNKNLRQFVRKDIFPKLIRFKSSETKKWNFPLSPNDMARSGGIASMMRLPVQNSSVGLNACFVGIPLDCGTSNRSGTRYCA